ncbi:hypothetical protein K440DRAFT_636840 [Wilcoxina mikolae CBS 423.85]|nr:hypothetical protein K440DRAFT_636840 [Wilcoxina mikolae CBS 423.85]
MTHYLAVRLAHRTTPCSVDPLQKRWKRRREFTPDDDHPLVSALISIGFVCEQCKSSTNTFAYWGERYAGECYPVPIALEGFRLDQSLDKVLCVGYGGELKLCGPGEFMAISHVWDHGWRGTSENGLCSRVLGMLLNVASRFGLEWVLLDVTMISSDKEIRTMRINAMNLCDKVSETPLDKIILFGRERRTTKKVDYVRALYPLFGLQWSGPNTTLEEGQIRLLQHLGDDSSRCAFLFGPVGLPSSWCWAPLSLTGCSGYLQERDMSATSGGLAGAWSTRAVRALSRGAVVGPGGPGVLVEQTGGMCDLMIFETVDTRQQHSFLKRPSRIPTTTVWQKLDGWEFWRA